MTRKGHSVTVFAPDTGDVPEGARFISAGSSVPIPANRSIARICLSPRVLSSAKRILLGGGFDVVHVHEPFVPLVSVAAVLYASTRTVGTFHASAEGGLALYRLVQAFLKGVRGRIDCCTAVSQAAKELVSRYFPGKYEIVPNGVDTTFFKPVEKRPDSFPVKNCPLILFVGRGEPRKGLQVLLESFRKLLGDIPSCKLVIVGEGHSKEKYISTYSLPKDSLFVPGFLPDEEMRVFYSLADVFCAPALGGESFGLVLLEAMACGTPVVVSDIPGYREVVDATGGGILFKKGDAESLYHALIDVLTDEKLRVELGRRGLEGAQGFSWSSIADRVEKIYMEC